MAAESPHQKKVMLAKRHSCQELEKSARPVKVGRAQSQSRVVFLGRGGCERLSLGWVSKEAGRQGWSGGGSSRAWKPW